MRGQCRHHVLERHGPGEIEVARVRGRLVDLGEYPALVDLYLGDTDVVGELVRFADVRPLLEELDAVEGYLGPGVPGSLYHRVFVEVVTEADHTRMAWTYVYASATDAPTIEDGDWRVRSPDAGAPRRDEG